MASWVVFVGTWYSHGLHAGVRGGAAAFLAWAVVRELAPRRAWPSALAPFAAVAFAIPSETNVLACLGALLAVRIATQSTGGGPTWFDCVWLVPFAAWLATRSEALPIALVLAAVVFADAPPRRLRIAGLMMLGAAILIGSVEGTLTMRFGHDHLNDAEAGLALAAAAAWVWLLAVPLPRRLRVRTDRRKVHMRGARLRTARCVAGACVLTTIAWTGLEGIFALSSVSAAVIAAAVGGARQRAADPSDTLRA